MCSSKTTDEDELRAATNLQLLMQGHKDITSGQESDVREWQAEAKQGRSDGQYALALCHLVGHRVPLDPHRYQELLNAAALQGHAQANFLLASLKLLVAWHPRSPAPVVADTTASVPLPTERKRLLEDVKAKLSIAAREVPEAQFALGYLFYSGLVDAPDRTSQREQALSWLEKAAGNGHPFAAYWLGSIEEHSGRLHEAVKHWKQAQSTVPYALHSLGRISVEHAHDIVAALDYFEKCGAAGLPECAYQAAYMHAHGVGTVKDTARAKEWLSYGAGLENPSCLYTLGQQQLKATEDKERDIDQGVVFLRMAAQRGSVPALVQLSRLHETGDAASVGVARDARMAQELLKLATVVQRHNHQADDSSQPSFNDIPVWVESELVVPQVTARQV